MLAGALLRASRLLLFAYFKLCLFFGLFSASRIYANNENISRIWICILNSNNTRALLAFNVIAFEYITRR